MSGFLDKFVQSAEQGESSRGHKRRRVEEEHVDFFQSIAQKMWTARESAVQAEKSHVEMEARVGLLCRGSRRWKALVATPMPSGDAKSITLDEAFRAQTDIEFKAGIDESAASGIKKALLSCNMKPHVQPTRIQRVDAQHRRWEVAEGASPQSITASEDKRVSLPTPLHRPHAAQNLKPPYQTSSQNK